MALSCFGHFPSDLLALDLDPRDTQSVHHRWPFTIDSYRGYPLVGVQPIGKWYTYQTDPSILPKRTPLVSTHFSRSSTHRRSGPPPSDLPVTSRSAGRALALAQVGSTITWWGVSSCTSDKAVAWAERVQRFTERKRTKEWWWLLFPRLVALILFVCMSVEEKLRS